MDKKWLHQHHVQYWLDSLRAVNEKVAGETSGYRVPVMRDVLKSHV